jgi:hypothetical protein
MITNMFNDTVPKDYVMPDEEHTLRYMLWLNHGRLTGHYLYGDDGELNCNSCGIDFRRHTVKSILDALSEQNMTRVIKTYATADDNEEHF